MISNWCEITSFNKNLLEGWNLPTKVNISDFSLLDSDKDYIFKFSLFIKDELPEFQMTIIAVRKGNILTLKDEINSFNWNFNYIILSQLP